MSLNVSFLGGGRLAFAAAAPARGVADLYDVRRRRAIPLPPAPPERGQGGGGRHGAVGIDLLGALGLARLAVDGAGGVQQRASDAGPLRRVLRW
uniref:Uncharacterized protein n=1 Tax=Arundo donax TaxID=35708 RepID=A0A0A9FL42_ARUDO